MPDSTLYPRYACVRLEEALADTPVVLVHAPASAARLRHSLQHESE